MGEKSVNRSASELLSIGKPISKSDGMIDIGDLVLKNWFLLLASLGVGLVLGVLAYLKLGPVYSAETSVLVSRRVESPIHADGRRVSGERSAHVEIIQSPMIVGRAVDLGHLNELATLRTSKEPIQDIIESLKVSRSSGEDSSDLNVLELSYKTSSRSDAAVILDAIVVAYGDYLKNTREQTTLEMLNLVQQARDTLSAEISEKESAYLTFRNESPLHFKTAPGVQGGLTSITNIHQDQVEALAKEVSEVRIKKLQLQTKLETLASAINAGESSQTLRMLVDQFMQSEQKASTQTINVEGDGRSGLETNLVTLMLEEEKLRRDFADNHPDVQRVRKQLEVVREYYRRQGVLAPDLSQQAKPGQTGLAAQSDLIQAFQATIRLQINELERREAQLNVAYDDASRRAKEFARFLATDQTLSEDLGRVKNLYEIVVKQMRELDLSKDNSGYRLNQIAPVRAELDFKRVLKLVGGGGFATFAAVFALLYLRELQDTRVRTLADLRNLYDGAVLGSVPLFSNPSRNLEQARQTGLDPMLFYIHQPGSPEAEAYRSLRTTMYVRAATEHVRTMVVSSAEPGDGKSTSICNLAAAAAQAGRSVLLIDADLRRPTVHRLLSLNSELGLSAILAGDIDPETAVQETGIEGLQAISAGTLPDKPAELLESQQLGKLLAWARSRYDLVMIDAPPMLAVSDAFVVAQQTDGMLLIVRMDKNRQASLARVRDLMDSHNIRLFGVVGNGGTATGGEYEYRGGYAGRYTQRPVAERDPASTPAK